LAAADETTRLSSLLAQLPALTHLLDLGCGICADVPTYFAAGAQRVCAVDWDRIALRAARRIHRSKALCLIYGDVRTIAFAPHAFDAILIRHPDVERAPLIWRTALARAPRWLKHTGRLLLTTYSLTELSALRSICRAARLRAVPLDEHRLKPAPLSGRDSYALCFALNT
jgi:SAM-dependent methyltransferase